MAGGNDKLAPFKAAYAALGIPGRIAFGVGLFALVALAISVYGFTSGLIKSSVSIPPGAGGPQAEQHKAEFDRYLAQFNGRSLFIVPGNRRKPDYAPSVAETTAPKAPDRYEGPDIIAMILDTVWFADGKRMKVGDPAQDNLEVVGVNAPWEAKVKWKDVEFTVPLFQRDRLVIKDDSKPNATEAKPPETQAAKPEDPKPDPTKPVFKPDPTKQAAANPPKAPDPGTKPPEPGAAPGPAPATEPPAETQPSDPDGAIQ
jgi:hypothetical protein